MMMAERATRPGDFLIALIISLAASACGNEADSPGGGTAAVAAVDTVNGVERLRYQAEASPDLGWGLDTAFVIGDAFAEEAYQFNEVTPEGLGATSAGDLLVLDRQGKRVLRYGQGGEHLATYGREGEGPGELSQPLAFDVGPEDTVWVADFSNARLTGYPLEGGEPRVLPFAEDAGFPGQRMAALDSGYLIQFRPLFNFSGGSGGVQMSRGGDAAQEPVLPLVRFSRDDLAPVDTLWRTPEPPMDMVQLEMGDRLMITMMSREFHPDFLWDAFSDGGIVESDTAAYSLAVVDPSGRVVRRIERDPAPRSVTEADREAARERVREESSQGGGVRIGGAGPDEETQRRMLEQRLEKMTFSETVPRIVSLRVDPQDRIWVGVTEDVADEMARIDIYDRDGRLLGEIRDFPMPHAFLGPDRVAILRRDDMDVQQVVVLDLTGAGADDVSPRRPS